MACLLIVVLCASESCIVFFLGPSNFGMHHGFPFVHGVGDFVQASVNAVSNSVQSTLSSSCTWFSWVVSVQVTSLPS